jgi:hypothetical protein
VITPQPARTAAPQQHRKQYRNNYTITPPSPQYKGRSILESAAVASSYHILQRVYAMHPCHHTPTRLLSDSSVNLPPKKRAFFVRILRERAAVMSAPGVYPTPPELAAIVLALRRCEVGGGYRDVGVTRDMVMCR